MNSQQQKRSITAYKGKKLESSPLKTMKKQMKNKNKDDPQLLYASYYTFSSKKRGSNIYKMELTDKSLYKQMYLNKGQESYNESKINKSINIMCIEKLKQFNQDLKKIKRRQKHNIQQIVDKCMIKIIKNDQQINQQPLTLTSNLLMKWFKFQFKYIPPMISQLIVHYGKGQLYQYEQIITKQQIKDRIGFIISGKMQFYRVNQLGIIIKAGSTIHEELFLKRKTQDWQIKTIGYVFIVWIDQKNWFQMRKKAFLIHDLKYDFHVMQNFLRRKFIAKWLK